MGSRRRTSTALAAEREAVLERGRQRAIEVFEDQVSNMSSDLRRLADKLEELAKTVPFDSRAVNVARQISSAITDLLAGRVVDGLFDVALLIDQVGDDMARPPDRRQLDGGSQQLPPSDGH